MADEHKQTQSDFDPFDPGHATLEVDEYDPFEPGRCAPEFEEYAREHYAKQRGGQSTGGSAGGAHVAATSKAKGSELNDTAYAPRKHTAVGVVLCIVLAVVIEVFLFNFAYFASALYPEVTSDYLIDGDTPAEALPITIDSDVSGFTITGLDDTVDNIHISLHDANASSTSTATATTGAIGADEQATYINVVMQLTDEGNANWYTLPTVTVNLADEQTSYITLNPSGNCHSIRVTLSNLAEDDEIILTAVGLNERVPFSFDPLRLLEILAVLLVLYALRPASSLFSKVLNMNRGWQAAVIVCVVIAEFAVAALIILSDSTYLNLAQTHVNENYFQYNKLAEALLEGHFYLNDVPSDALIAMDNPYDTTARDALGVEYLWDHAYYQGKYYVYFGILPCLIFYVPWLAITGTGFPTWFGIIISCGFFAMGAAYLLYKMCKRWFPGTSLGVFIAIDIMLFVASGALICAYTPTLYFLPQALGMALIAWGLGFWVDGTAHGRIRVGRVMFGSLLIGLTLACRPQMILAALLGIVLFVPFVTKAESAGARAKAFGAFIAALIPFIIVAAGVCYYNMARFGSPLDFGANYNLTTNDMIHRGFHIERIPFGLFAYLIQLPVLVSQFPFLHQTYLDPSYQGVTISEPMFGGYFFLFPMTLAVVTLAFTHKSLKQKGLFGFAIVSLIIAFVIVNFDLQAAGILMRYMADFGIFVALAAAITLLDLAEVKSGIASQTTFIEQAPSYGSITGTVSVRRVALYFIFITLIIMVVAAVLLQAVV